MKTFNIFNNTVSFDENFIDYIKIMQDANFYKLAFYDRYMAKQQKNISSLEDFALCVQDLYNNGFSQEYMKLSEEIVNLYIKYGIYDMSKDMIELKNISSLNAHLQRMEPIINEITLFSSQIKEGVVDIENKWQNMVDDAVQGHYFDVYSPHYSDIVMNEWFNNREKERVEKKRQQLYNKNVNRTLNDYVNQIMPLCERYIDEMQQLIYEDVTKTVDTMYRNCAMDLVVKGKISSFSQYTDSLNSGAILENIDKIANKEVVEEQLVNLLQTDSINPLLHLKILDHITDNDIPQYVEIVKFLKIENLIFYIYVENFTKGEYQNKELNDKCLTILKSVKDSLDMGFISKENSPFIYTDDTFIENIMAIKIYFECVKKIFGPDNETIKKKEQKLFVKAIKEASKGTNLIYDGSINTLDYNYLCEFWKKTRKQLNFTMKTQEITQDVSNNIAEWIKNHIMLTIIIIIIVFSLIFGK